MMITKDIGYNSGGEFKTHVGRANTKEYGIWLCMLQRCYDPKVQAKYPTYIGCSVCEEWLDFQVFAEWYVNNEFYGLGYHLDKDLLVKGNKIYSPDFCVLIPVQLNVLLTNGAKIRGSYPQGVSFNKPKKRYQANISLNGRSKLLGRFKCPNEAHAAYVIAKEAYVKEKALEWRGRIDERVFEALMNWTLY